MDKNLSCKRCKQGIDQGIDDSTTELWIMDCTKAIRILIIKLVVLCYSCLLLQFCSYFGTAALFKNFVDSVHSL